VVLEMRMTEIHTLRKENVRLEEKLEEYDTMKFQLGKATAQAEDLKSQLNSRLDLERYNHC
jgi:cell division septum initiation protein DivIVA